ncbi:MAG: DUF6769 family protein [Prolixibacteraceae bacterium]
MRRTTAVIFVLLANIALLAVAVIPHHHHLRQICMEEIHCNNDCCGNNKPDTHEHDAGNKADFCVLKQAVVIPANPYKPDYKLLLTDHHPFSDSFYFTLFHTGRTALITEACRTVVVPRITSGYSCIIISFSGLRAPPVA